MKNETDYVFPPWWGRLTKMVNLDTHPMTKEEADAIRADWFLEQRAKWQASLQHEAGMWEEFGDIAPPEDGQSLEQGMNETTNNEFQVK